MIDEYKNAKVGRDQTEDKRAEYKAKYTYLECKVKKSCHNDKKEWLENKGDEAQQAAVMNNMRTVLHCMRSNRDNKQCKQSYQGQEWQHSA